MTATERPSDIELADRLDQLADAITKGFDAARSEFTMRIPAEPKRDADLVLSEAAMRLRARTLDAAPADPVVSAECWRRAVDEIFFELCVDDPLSNAGWEMVEQRALELAREGK